MKVLSYCVAFCLIFSVAFAITDEALNKMGEDAHQKIMSQNAQYRDAVVEKWVQKVFQKIISANPQLKAKNYKLLMLEDYSLNAFAIPPRYIYLNRGILPFISSDSELAFVLGHEIAHLENNHSKHQAEGQEFSNLFGSVLGVGTALVLNSDILGGLVQGTTSQLAGGFMTHFGREHEFVADQGGLELLVHTGYNGDEGIRFVRKMINYSAMMQSDEKRYDFSATHPPSEERVEKIQEWFKNNPLKTQVAKGYLSPTILKRLTFTRDQNEAVMNEEFAFFPKLGLGFKKLQNDTDLNVYPNPAILAVSSKEKAPTFFIMKKPWKGKVASLSKESKKYFVEMMELDTWLDLEPAAVPFKQIDNAQHFMKIGKNIACLMSFSKNGNMYVVVYLYEPENTSEPIAPIKKSFSKILNQNLFLRKPFSVPNHALQLKTVHSNENLLQFSERMLKEINRERAKIKNPYPNHIEVDLIEITEAHIQQYLTQIKAFNGIEAVTPGQLIKVPWYVGFSI